MGGSTMEQNHNHKVVIINREPVVVDGVVHVEKFDALEIILETDLGLLAQRGEDMHIKQPDVLVEQANDVFEVFFLGLALGVVVDIYRAMTQLGRPSKAILFPLDIAFWLACSTGVFAYLLWTTSGEARAYVFGLLLLGFYSEQKILGGRLRRGVRAFLRWFMVSGKSFLGHSIIIVDFVLGVILIPVRFLVHRPLLRVLSNIERAVNHWRTRGAKKDL
ncbi:MAG: Spore protein YabP [Firmicutes bacterium]|nr:Spore protein YabP [Bacillota bacterium]